MPGSNARLPVLQQPSFSAFWDLQNNTGIHLCNIKEGGRRSMIVSETGSHLEGSLTPVSHNKLSKADHHIFMLAKQPLSQARTIVSSCTYTDHGPEYHEYGQPCSSFLTRRCRSLLLLHSSAICCSRTRPVMSGFLWEDARPLLLSAIANNSLADLFFSRHISFLF